MKPNRVLIFSLVYYPRNIGGAEVAVKEITDRIPPPLSAKENGGGFEFDMVTMRKHAPAFERIGNVSVYRVGLPWPGSNTKSSKIFPFSKLVFPFLAYRKALKLHGEKPYDAIFGLMASYAGYAAMLFKMKHPEVPFVLDVQEGDNFEKRGGIWKPMFKKIFASADRIIAISAFLADWSKKMRAKCPITVVPNGVDLDLFGKPINADHRKRIRTDLGFKDSDIVLATASRLVHKNAVDDIISALGYLDDNYKLLIIGSGARESALKKQATALTSGARNDIAARSNSRVVFKGFVPHAELPKYLQASDIFVRPSRSEGLGNSFLEAMAAGVPVIGTAVGGIVDFLKDGETGLICEVDNPKSIAQKAEKLAKDKESREYIVRQARKLVDEKYGWDGIAMGIAALLKESIHKYGSV